MKTFRVYSPVLKDFYTSPARKTVWVSERHARNNLTDAQTADPQANWQLMEFTANR